MNLRDLCSFRTNIFGSTTKHCSRADNAFPWSVHTTQSGNSGPQTYCSRAVSLIWGMFPSNTSISGSAAKTFQPCITSRWRDVFGSAQVALVMQRFYFVFVFTFWAVKIVRCALVFCSVKRCSRAMGMVCCGWNQVWQNAEYVCSCRSRAIIGLIYWSSEIIVLIQRPFGYRSFSLF